VLYFTLAMTGASMLTLPFAFRWPANPADLVMLISVGLVGGLAQLLITHSYRYAEATVLAPFDYLQLVWALIFGYAFFGEVPVALVIAGALIIAASSTFISMRERALARLARASSPDGAV
jgi:drug/metabolite transporter (DMT)-like permease